MENIWIVFLILLCGVLNIASFIYGAKIGQAVKNNEKIETPKLSDIETPSEWYHRREKEKQEETKQERFNTIFRNVEAYNGTEFGQEDVPNI